ncbi:MAG: CcoQ/FixQ family Cbb3-type cytochrome c oxidase assembly chaperone [Geminicoccaceae bacterium]
MDALIAYLQVLGRMVDFTDACAPRTSCSGTRMDTHCLPQAALAGWTFLLFVGIAAWVYWPSRKSEMDDNARIPFRDEEMKNGR